jgi:hypothetical protein
MVIVCTEAELHAAQERGEREIRVEGELAQRIHDSFRAATGRKIALGVIAMVGAVGAIAMLGPFGAAIGVPVLAKAGAAASAGGWTAGEIATLIGVSGGSVGLIIAILKGYDEIDFQTQPLRLTLRRR